MSVLTSEFFWGIVVGLLLSLFGSFALAKFSSYITHNERKKVVRQLCGDLVKNICKIVDEMDATRDRGKLIHSDFLNLIDVEINIYGRNREHLILLPSETRDQLRQFMNDVAIKRTDVIQSLDKFYDVIRLSDQIRAEGRIDDAERMRAGSTEPLLAAQSAADKLVAITKGANGLLAALNR